MTNINEAIIRVAPRDDGQLILNEERPAGLFFLGTISEGKELISDRDWRITYRAVTDTYLVEIAYLSGFDPNDEWQGGVAEWGIGKTEDEAWRYALGAALGGYDDPELKYSRIP